MSMGKYILRRVALFIPTLFFISLLSFIISHSAPGDPVATMLHLDENLKSGSAPALIKKMKQDKRHEMGLDLPVFYIGLGTLADPDAVVKAASNEELAMLTDISRESGQPKQVARYDSLLNKCIVIYSNIPMKTLSQAQFDALQSSLYHYNKLLECWKDVDIKTHFAAIHKLMDANPFMNAFIEDLNKAELAYNETTAHPQPWKKYIPTINIHGLDNQYHRWMSKVILHGDFGISYSDRMPVIGTIKERFGWSFSLAMLSVLLAYLISLPIGIYAASHAGSFFDRSATLVLFMLYSLPTFFVGSILMLFFATKGFWYILPEGGVQDPGTYNENWNFLDKAIHHLPYLVLPLITYTYSSLAFLSRQARSGILSVMEEDYIRSARAKGLSERMVLWKHALRNSMLPMITIFASIFPVAFAGAVITETIFSIPGMGQLTYEAVINYDYPTIVAIFSISGFITVVCYLLSDILYAWADPRISYS